MLISQTTPDEHAPMPSPCRWPALITLPTLAKFQLVWRPLCDVVFPLLQPVRAHPQPSDYYPSISLVVNINYIQKFEHINIFYIFDQTDLYRVDVRLELRRECPPDR